MDVITARWNIPTKAGPGSISTILTLPVTGPILESVCVLCPLATYDPSKSGVKVLDQGRPIYPATGTTDLTAVMSGRGAWAPLMPLAVGPVFIEKINDELSGSPYVLTFDFYNEDTADFIVLVMVKIAMDLKPLAVSDKTLVDLISPVGGMIQNLIDRVFPPKVN